MRTYDLRYTKQKDAHQSTQYYHRYRTYHNKSSNHLEAGLDVHGNLVASATDNSTVQIFDVKRGLELESDIGLGNDAVCVRFVEEKMSRSGLKLMAASDCTMNEYIFEGGEEEDFLGRDSLNRLPS